MIDGKMKEQMIAQNMKRIVQLEPTVSTLINRLDMATSSIYDVDETVQTAVMLSDILEQMNTDLTALINLIQND